MRSSTTALAVLLLMFLGLPGTAVAATQMVHLGNHMTGLSNGDIVPLAPDILNAQTGPAPFDLGIGNELLGPSFLASWTFNYVVADPILSASLSFGIWEHDSAASGDQVKSFTVDTADRTVDLNTVFNATGGTQTTMGSEYNTYMLALTNLADLADGSATVTLELQGPRWVENIDIFGNPPMPFVEELVGPNAAHLIFSTLTIETQDVNGVVPEPASWMLLTLGLGGVASSRRRRG